jgi:hypothetical protein
VARAKKEAPAKIASLQEELFRLQREVEISHRAQELIESRKEAQAASKCRALKAAEVERARSLRVLSTQNNLRQSWQQFIGNLHPAHYFLLRPFIFCFQNRSSLLARSLSPVWTMQPENRGLRTLLSGM